MNKMGTRELVEASILVAISAVIMILNEYVPFFMLVGVILWPIPITLLTFKYNVRVSIISLIVLFAIVFGIITPLSAFGLIIMYGLPAIVLGFCLRKGFSAFITIIAVSITTFLTYILALKFSALLFGVDILKETYRMFDEAAAGLTKFMNGMGFSEEQINEIIPQGKISDLLNAFLPGALAMASLVGSYINYYIVAAIFRRLRLKINELKPMDQWYINNSLSFGLFFVTAVTGLLMISGVDNADIAFNAVYMLFNFVFIIDGFAVISWFFKKRGVPGKAIVLIIILLIITNISMFVFYLGLIDYIMDFRKINPMRRRRTPPGD